jgi:L-fuculose-phosphate aldolase
MKVFSAKDAEQLVAQGQKEFVYTREIQVTPGARDVFSDAGVKLVFQSRNGSAGAAQSVSPSVVTAKPDFRPAMPKAQNKYEELFYSPEAEKLKQEICDIGKRLWQREYTDGNGGNISAKLGDYFLCTPTGVSKGFMTPDMLCLVDVNGKQLAGTWKRTSEILTHMGIYRYTPEAKSVVHAHPVHATAYAIAGVEPPGSLIPEIEVFVGKLPLAPYATPGSDEMSEIIGKLAKDHQSVLMGNHGVICWGTGVEDAYFKMEITDAYCRTLVVGSHIPGASTRIPCDKLQELLELKKTLGVPDARFAKDPKEICEPDPWLKIKDRPQACCSPAVNGKGEVATGDPASMTDAEVEEAVQRITEEILQQLGGNR